MNTYRPGDRIITLSDRKLGIIYEESVIENYLRVRFDEVYYGYDDYDLVHIADLEYEYSALDDYV